MRPAPRAQARLLPDGRRLHLQDGPIDLIVEAAGEPAEVAAAYRAAASRFRFVLDELCSELAALRSPSRAPARAFRTPVAQRMENAAALHAAETFITPMAAVAGSVADEILAVMRAEAGAGLKRLSVNNGGDIAFWLGPGETTTLGLVDRPDRPSLFARASIAAGDGIGGVATSGAPGRSFSLGVADAVTILARAPRRPTPPRPSSPTAWTFPATRASRAPPPAASSPTAISATGSSRGMFRRWTGNRSPARSTAASPSLETCSGAA